ncbi:hypothetical protein [Phytoactinopolyspora halophila]|nr:hypothetical protein [Phytoactinopolyspora halophila]
MRLSIDRRFRGPVSSGNGGYVCGLVAAHMQAPVVEVTLRKPPPLEVPLEIVPGDGGARLVEGDETVAEGVPAPSAMEGSVAVPPVDVAEARAASAAYPGLAEHPFPECFVCGPLREAGDGMRLFPGRLDGERTACLWTVSEDDAGDVRRVWAGLDCPGGWTAPIEGRPMVLGRMAARIEATPSAGEVCVVMGQLLGGEGRKTWTATTIYSAGGHELGRALATWITLPT